MGETLTPRQLCNNSYHLAIRSSLLTIQSTLFLQETMLQSQHAIFTDIKATIASQNLTLQKTTKNLVDFFSKISSYQSPALPQPRSAAPLQTSPPPENSSTTNSTTPAPPTVPAAPNPQPPLPLFPALQTSLLNDMETLPSIPSLLPTTVPTNASAVLITFMPTNNTVAITPSSDGKLFNNHLTQTEVSAENKSSTIDITNPSDLDNQNEQEISTRGLMGISDSKSIQQETSPFKQSTAALDDSGSLINLLHPFTAPDLLKLSDPEQLVGQNIFQQHRTEISEIQNKNEGSMMESPVFVLDLMLVPLSDDSKILENLSVSDNILKPGPEFKYDLVYLKSTFEWIGGWDSVELFVDMTGRKFLQEISYGTMLISFFILEVSYQWNGTADWLQFENKIVIFDPAGILIY